MERHPFRQDSGCEWRTDETRPLVSVSALCSVKWFDTDGWMTGWTFDPVAQLRGADGAVALGRSRRGDTKQPRKIIALQPWGWPLGTTIVVYFTENVTVGVRPTWQLSEEGALYCFCPGRQKPKLQHSYGQSTEILRSRTRGELSDPGSPVERTVQWK